LGIALLLYILGSLIVLWDDFAEIFLSEIIVLLAKVKGMDKRIAAAPGSKHYWDTKR
jgi:hypothetical protein